jgi:hypothetical protein
MFRQDSLTEFVCAKSDDDELIFEDLITFDNCGHSICEECLSNPPIECSKCGLTTDRDLINEVESIISIDMIKRNLSRLYKKIEKSTSENIDKISSNYSLISFGLAY